MSSAHAAENTQSSASVEIRGPITPECEALLSSEAMDFLAELVRAFSPRIRTLLDARRARQARFDRGTVPDFLPETRKIRQQDWQVAPIPEPLLDRRVEITGPVDRKMVINGLNSGARVFMADFEDASTPSWSNMIQGQRNLYDAVRRQIDFSDERGKAYRLNRDTALLLVRVRGLHLPEKDLRVDGEAVPGALMDFALHCFHNSEALLAQGAGPWFYLPKLEHWREAALWAEVFDWAEQRLSLEKGSIRATVLIETLPAVFQMDEILHVLRDYVVGLNCGRWDYIFSYIKTFHAHPDRILPDRETVGMTVPFLRAYSRLLIETCHRRGALAMGGMAAQIPVRDDPEANAAALAKVREDKEREARDGHDGTWVAHPGLIPEAMAVFDAVLAGPNQLDRAVQDHGIGRAELLAHPEGAITEAGFRRNVEVGLAYTAAWLSGRGCVPIHHLMEDAATAEIARAQLWQWLHHSDARFEVGGAITFAFFSQVLEESLAALLQGEGEDGPDAGHYRAAARLFHRLTESEQFADFLTLEAYDSIA
ncbi:malate synthase [Natronospira proteinivora]|uniref:malate synthase n=1 Tax=Natronospira proteinivora TaxID=1807133 RepID=A0ABT1G6D2_9GAMM|nr:malate synthase A [Natronospira proteinivora]MCP1726811.1 malate synthase [Natronospira proteinivora]